MKLHIKRTIILLLSLTLILTACADGGGPESESTYIGPSDSDPSDEVPSEKLDQIHFSAGEDQNKIITDDAFIQAATGVEGTGITSYSSSDTDIATVDSTGLVNIAGTGITVITASNSGDTDYNPSTDSYVLTVRNTSFITTWKTDHPGASEDNQITIPVYSGETYDYIVDWGDGTSDTGITGEKTHTYSSAGTYTVSITGVFPRIYFNKSRDMEKILTIEEWGGIEWKSMANAFAGCSNLTYNAKDNPDLSEVTDMSGMFNSAIQFNGDINGWDVSNVTDMSGMFLKAFSFDGNISGWDVGSVIYMSNMFNQATSFNCNLNGWDVGNVIYMHNMFHDAKAFNKSVYAWDVGNVIDMRGMFYGAEVFNRDMNSWNVSNVTNMSDMFHEAFSFNGHISDWRVGNVTNMSGMFHYASSFNSDISNWNVRNVTDMSYMFARTSFNSDISDWNVRNVTDMSYMFYYIDISYIDISRWVVLNVTNMSNMFANASSFNKYLGLWDVSNVTNMRRMFFNASSFSDRDLSVWNVSKVTDHLHFGTGWGEGNTEPNWP